jgi:ABC-type glycerol-3-phosphate transport system permease component
MLAGAVTATVPVILVFVFAQRYFLREFRGVGWLGR